MKLKSRFYKTFISTVMALTMTLTLSLAMPLNFAEAKQAAADSGTKSAVTETNTGSKSGIKAKTDKDKKNEASSVLWKFLHSMLLVAGSCGAIFLVLLAYKKIKRANFVQTQNIEIEKNLNSPETVEEATRFIIEKF